MNPEQLKKNFNENGFDFLYFLDRQKAADYLLGEIRHTSVGIGGSVTVDELGIYETLSLQNEVFWHWKQGAAVREQAKDAEVYITSANALSVTGEIINIDGCGNRVAATLYGPKRVFFVCGINKLAADTESALYRARNIAGPLNARRLGSNTPCAKAKGEPRCFNCHSPERICRGELTLTRKPLGIDSMTVILINEKLGY